ncbi:MAG: Y-family DNA polymerase [Paludibacter sp.]|nr:Y-family DNA polymerase [Paludibacter sp.]
MFGLLDCNNFYASCERVFNPSLNGKPVVVLSNNDGCVIARSVEAKVLGIPMGEPAYKLKELIETNQVHVFSSNYVLYGDMSHRVMNTIALFAPEMEIYSIDEAFLLLKGFENIDFKVFGENVVNTVTRNTGIPVSLGIAPTKTLAKVANKFAKKYKAYKGVCFIDSDEKREKALKLTEIGDVWGIGRRYSKKLQYYSVNTAWDFTQRTKSWVRQTMGVVGERTWMELRGTPCFEMESPKSKKSICTSRSFGEKLTELAPISEAVANFAASCAEKLRKQHSYGCVLTVFIHTNPHATNQPQYYNQTVMQLSVPTNDSTELINVALRGLSSIFKEGYRYKKAGVIVSEIVPERPLQGDLFDVRNREKYNKVMSVMDSLNDSYGKQKVKIASQGFDRKWKLKNEKLSPCYTTNLSDILEVIADEELPV